MCLSRTKFTLFFVIVLIFPSRICDAIATQRPGTSNNSHPQADSTSLFNADILRIASRTTKRSGNFNPIHAAEHSERMLFQMIDMFEQSQHNTALPNAETFRIVLKSYANLGRVRWKDGENVNVSMEEQNKYDDSNGRNSKNESKAPPKDLISAVDRMENILIKFDDFSWEDEDGKICHLQPNTNILNLILKAYAKCSFQSIPYNSSDLKEEDMTLPWLGKKEDRGSYAQRAEKVLNIMLRSEDESMIPNGVTYASVIEAWSCQQPNLKMLAHADWEIKNHRNENIKYSCVTNASRWLPKLESLYEVEVERDESIEGKDRRNMRRLLLWAYSDTLEGWARCGMDKSARKAYDCMVKIEELSDEDVADVERIQTTPLDFDEERNEFSSEPSESASRYQDWIVQPNLKLFDEMDEFLHPEYPIYPNSQSYTSTIMVLSRSRAANAPETAHNLLNKMLKLYDSGNWFKNRPNLVAFNSVISAYGKSPKFNGAEMAEKVLNLVEELYFSSPQYKYLKPDVVTFNAAVTAWSKSKEEAAVYRAEEIVERMEEHYNSYGSNFLDVKPDMYTYNSLIFAWLRSDLGKTSAENAESILRLLIEKYDNGEKEYLPSQKAFCSVVNAWSKSFVPSDTVDHNSWINNKSLSEAYSVKRAMGLLELMERMYSEGINSLKPDVITYTSVIDSIARSRMTEGSEMAFELLHKMERRFKKSGDKSMKPNVKSYSCVLQSLIHSQRADKHNRANGVLEHMKQMDVEPNSFTYNYVINCAATVQGDEAVKMDAFKIALNAFTNLRSSPDHQTDSFTFAFFLKACCLMPMTKLRSEIATKTFQECCSYGKVNDEVIKRLSRVFMDEPEELRAILKCNKANAKFVTAYDLPKSWSQHAAGKKKSRGRKNL
uniref:Pentacotripeptide-repeat region of PRORP domain-containing protein n=1 Tax=Chaetoceros debilis TaxID=122233 RepID=A0A7S3V5L1_9STRA|mmetsp:Transcript_6239/g.8961  ORF Transcript_6239/g.8961 Transcript_6239/m.8961 type:complete len:891 (+) Transcript_6239:147-2819(+)